MNKSECKKYLKRAYKKMIAYNKDITPKDFEVEMVKAISEETEEYIAYTKIAIDNMKNSANEKITLKDLLEEIDVLPNIYTPIAAIQKSNTL